MDFELDRDSPLPLYQQIEEWIRHQTASGVWPEGSQIPAEQELTERLGVNRGTLRKAIANLMKEGLLEPVHGKGTFVTASRLGQRLADSFITLSESLLERKIPFRTVVRSAEVVPADDRVATLLALPEGSRVFRLERVRYVDDIPVVALENHVVYEKCPGIEGADFERERLFHVLERDHGLAITWGRRTFEAAIADSRVAPVLDLNPGDAVMVVQQLSHLSDDTPVELSDLWFRGDRFRLSAHMKRLRVAGGLRELLVKS